MRTRPAATFPAIDAKYSLLQMSLIDTWAATGAGAMMLTENSLYTVEAWKLFLDRLTRRRRVDRLALVRREKPRRDLAICSAWPSRRCWRRREHPVRHIALVTNGPLATLVLSRQPFSAEDNLTLYDTCRKLRFTLAASPIKLAEDPQLRAILVHLPRRAAYVRRRGARLRFDPPTDDDPYFFNILRLGDITRCFSVPSQGTMSGNLVATASLAWADCRAVDHGRRDGAGALVASGKRRNGGGHLAPGPGPPTSRSSAPGSCSWKLPSFSGSPSSWVIRSTPWPCSCRRSS